MPPNGVEFSPIPLLCCIACVVGPAWAIISPGELTEIDDSAPHTPVRYDSLPVLFFLPTSFRARLDFGFKYFVHHKDQMRFPKVQVEYCRFDENIMFVYIAYKN